MGAHFLALFRMLQLIADNFPYLLVPSLDGLLYMFNMKSSSLSLVPLNANARIMIGNDEVAGGTFVTSTGIDPLTGKVFHFKILMNLVAFDVSVEAEFVF